MKHTSVYHLQLIAYSKRTLKTRLEERFSVQQVKEMMVKEGLADIVISPGVPFYHAVGKKM